jgi:hypothetical protein
VDKFAPNALGETLAAGRVADCYLGLLLPPGPAGELEAGTVLVVARLRCWILEFLSPREAWCMSCSPATQSARPGSWCLWPT